MLVSRQSVVLMSMILLRMNTPIVNLSRQMNYLIQTET